MRTLAGNENSMIFFLCIGHRFGRADLRRRMRDYVRGLLAPVGRKNAWQPAEFAGHRTPDGFQRLLNGATRDADDVRDDLQSYVAKHLGDDNGVLVIDDTGFLEKGTTSAGVQRQYSGTAGRTENRQIGVFAAYTSAAGRTLVDREPYLPKSWTDDRERCRAAKVPDERGFATKGEPAKRLVLRSLASDLPLAWVAADAAYGQEGRFRRPLEQSGSATCSRCPSLSRSSAHGSTTSTTLRTKPPTRQESETLLEY
ncbi:IS701 family transposase [Streptomyces sp. NPDC052020]|uniref:IS701 family transposase n=1 Tax=Streptomyces sp. NPDC052020 TaxID=3155677 RepID=UPI00344AF9EF